MNPANAAVRTMQIINPGAGPPDEPNRTLLRDVSLGEQTHVLGHPPLGLHAADVVHRCSLETSALQNQAQVFTVLLRQSLASDAL
ncbi:unnamed protein product [Arctogadus glacialis]